MRQWVRRPLAFRLGGRLYNACVTYVIRPDPQGFDAHVSNSGD